MLQTSEAYSGLAFRPGDFDSFRDCLDYAARGGNNITLYSGRGQIEEILPYRDLIGRARLLGRKMLRAGLRAGDRVALIAETDGDFLRMFFACQYAGLVPAPLPLPMAFGGREAYLNHIRRMIEAASASAAFAPRDLGTWLREATEGLDLVCAGTADDLEVIPEDGADFPAIAPEALAYLQFSSGSTRFPMGVAITQHALMSNVRAIARRGLKARYEDRAVSWLPFYHDMGLVGFLLTPVATQMSLDLLPTREFAKRPLTWLKLISQNRGTLSFSPSFGYDLCARRAETAARTGIDLSSWRVAGIGGDMIRPKVLERFAAAFASCGFRDNAFVPSYGMAEATLAVSFAPLGRPVLADRLDIDQLEHAGVAVAAGPNAIRKRDFVRCGRVLRDFEIEVRTSGGAVLPECSVGRIYLRGPSLMSEYFNQPAATAAALSAEGWLDTGDLGYLSDGELVITGRAKDVILMNGRNIAPQDLEWTVEHEVNGLRAGDAAAFSVDSEDGESVVILVQCRTTDGTRRAAMRGETEMVIRRLHGIECEVFLVPHNSLPHTSSGKLSRSRARQLYLDNGFEQPASLGAA
jgi:fatty-acyl-CoA synthase